MDLHKLLLTLVMDGRVSEWRLHTIECAEGHVSGYAKIPVGGQPQQIALECSICQGIAGIAVQVGETQKSAAPAKPVEPISSKKTSKPGVYPSLKKAWAAAEEQRIVERVNRDKTIEACWHEYQANRPVDSNYIRDELQRIADRTPYKNLTPELLFQATWLGWDGWKTGFIEHLATVFGCTVCAYKQRIKSVWQHLNPRIWLMMPFMVDATISPNKFRNLLEEAQKKAEKLSVHESLELKVVEN